VIETASKLAQNTELNGGWEVWLQVEIALAFIMDKANNVECERESPYLTGNEEAPWIESSYCATPYRENAIKCDFLMRRTGNTGPQGLTYIELKCMNPKPDPKKKKSDNELRLEAKKDAWERFKKDINKIQGIYSNKENCSYEKKVKIAAFALLAMYGSLEDESQESNSIHGVTTYVWDPSNKDVQPITKVQDKTTPRFFLVAAFVV
jgi:hypothetical protein